jgi:chloramphenicol-sensitive protein RarD
LNKTTYYLAAISAYAIWGFFSLVLVPLHAYSSVDILFYRVFSCALLMLLITILFRRQKCRDSLQLFRSLSPLKKRRVLTMNIGGSIFLTGNWFSFIYVMNHISIKATSLAYLVCPIITTLLSFFLLHDKLTKLQWLAVALSISGCLLLSYADITDMFFSMIVGFSYACYLISQREDAGFDKFIILTFHIVLSSFILLPFFPAFSGPAPVQLKFYAYIEIIAVFFTIIPLFLNLFALRGMNPSTAGMLLNINPIIAFILATTFFHEPISALQIAGYTIIFMAVIVFNARQIFKLPRVPLR